MILWLLGFLYKGATSVPGRGVLLIKVRNTVGECQLLDSVPWSELKEEISMALVPFLKNKCSENGSFLQFFNLDWSST